MKSYLIALAALVFFSFPSISAAETGRSGPYVSAFIGGSFARDVTISGYDSFSNKSYSDDVTFKSGIYTGGTGGYDFGFVRLEGELSYRYADIDSITFSNGSHFNTDDGYVGVFAVMGNVFFDLHNSSRVTPYLGGGIGFATVNLGDTSGSGPAGYGQLYVDSNDTVFAYQVGGGADIAINNRFSIDVGYRYFGTDKAHFSTSLGSNEFKFESHNVMVGFKAKF